MYANPDTPHHAHSPTVGSLFAGIGGFDLGFERAGFRTAWQVEIDPIRRAVLADRFPHAQRFDDVRACGRHNLLPVDVIVGGFPCQDLSTMGKRAGLAGERSGLFYEVVRIINELRPRWLVLENVTGLLSCNDGEDFAAVIGTLAECGYLGFWRVLNAQYFGVPTKRRRVFMVAGLGCQPPSSCWLMPDQWTAFLARRKRNKLASASRDGLTLPYLLAAHPAKSTSAVLASSLSRTDGVRWLSGAERLSIMGFARDWMRPTLQKLKVPETPSVRRSRSGSRDISSKNAHDEQ